MADRRSDKHERMRLNSRDEARYMIFWARRHNLVRCCFPTLAEAIKQARKYQQYGPEYIVDRCEGNTVVAERSAWQLVTPGAAKPRQNLGGVE